MTVMYQYKSTQYSYGALHLNYDANSTYTYLVNSYATASIKIDDTGYGARYSLIFPTTPAGEADERWSSLVASSSSGTTKKITTPKSGKFYLDRHPQYIYSANINAGQPSANATYQDYTGMDLRYTVNTSSTYMTINKKVFLYLHNFNPDDMSFEADATVGNIISLDKLATRFNGVKGYVYLYFLGCNTATWYTLNANFTQEQRIWRYEPSTGELVDLQSLQASKVITPQMFGAKGDGTTDDTNALSKAIAYARNNALTLHIPAGTYLTNLIDLSEGMLHIEGEGSDKTTILSKTKGQHIFRLNHLTDIYLTGLKLDDDESATSGMGCCIYMVDCSNVFLKDLYLVNFRHCGIMSYPSYTDGIICENYRIEDVICDGTLCYTGEYTDENNSGMILVSVKNGVGINCRAIKCSCFGLEWKGYRSANVNSKGTSTNCWWISCTTEKCGNAFPFGGEDASNYVDTWRNEYSGCISCSAIDTLRISFSTGYCHNIHFNSCISDVIGTFTTTTAGRVIAIENSKCCKFSGSVTNAVYNVCRIIGSDSCHVEITGLSLASTAYGKLYDTNTLSSANTNCIVDITTSSLNLANIVTNSNLSTALTTSGIQTNLSAADSNVSAIKTQYDYLFGDGNGFIISADRIIPHVNQIGYIGISTRRVNDVWTRRGSVENRLYALEQAVGTNGRS